jgi:hypothetical protein
LSKAREILVRFSSCLPAGRRRGWGEARNQGHGKRNTASVLVILLMGENQFQEYIPERRKAEPSLVLP